MLNNNVSTGSILVQKMGIGCKLHMNGYSMRSYILTIYIIHVECVDIMMNHHLQLDVKYNFTYATNGFLITCVDCNLFMITNYSRKLIILF